MPLPPPPPFFPPAGMSAASFFDPMVVDPASPTAALADDIDAQTGDHRSLFTTPNPVHAAVQFAFTLKDGSGAATSGRGHRFDKIRKMQRETPREIENEVDRILEPFVAAGLAEKIKVTVQAPNPANRSQGDFVLDFRELLTGARLDAIPGKVKP